ncbi:hypothetical protein CL1_1544 [Thermococcus cleftensis]|uniref:Uncharacterized protein n=1 Tax=Thermococcus cleftensis (strain DSM 27260 / KACC 17922 / CL1) TaxID=163003 RepID=I3ZVK9_THECF|nr:MULTISPECIES: hypothetical protein [Thermococcus]AFL95743.1 hypothetical protein CL1_1544 [Thermococcus cleftensis]NJE02559.1 hypothetical protein [Thermococcus sp. MV11]
MNRLLALAVALLIISASLGYAYHQQEREFEATLNGILDVSNIAVFCLEDMNTIGIMLDGNVSNDVLRERLSRYTYCSVMMEKAAFSLYLLNEDERYWRLHVAASNLEVYLHTAMNSPNPDEVLSDDVKLLDEISRELGAVLENGGVGELSPARAERLFNLTQRLSS